MNADASHSSSETIRSGDVLELRCKEKELPSKNTTEQCNVSDPSRSQPPSKDTYTTTNQTLGILT